MSTKWREQDTIPTEVYVKAPKIGQWVASRTGPEQVTRVDTIAGEPGQWIATVDTIGREWTRDRAHHGWWTVVPAPEVTP
jgi:hypothetical protein